MISSWFHSRPFLYMILVIWGTHASLPPAYPNYHSHIHITSCKFGLVYHNAHHILKASWKHFQHVYSSILLDLYKPTVGLEIRKLLSWLLESILPLKKQNFILVQIELFKVHPVLSQVFIYESFCALPTLIGRWGYLSLKTLIVQSEVCGYPQMYGKRFHAE